MMRDLSLYCSAKFTIPDHCNPCLVSFTWNAAWRIVPAVKWLADSISQQFCCQQNCYVTLLRAES